AWGPADVPLGEETEAYEVEILDGPGGDAVRTVTGLGAPAWLYTATDQTTDFGGAIAYPDTLTVRVFQLSATFGRGTGRETNLFTPLPVNAARPPTGDRDRWPTPPCCSCRCSPPARRISTSPSTRRCSGSTPWSSLPSRTAT